MLLHANGRAFQEGASAARYRDGSPASVITSKPASHDHLKTGQAQECRTTRF
jgi:hypothetical protein